MKRHTAYLAAPLGGDVAGNIRNALRWLAYTRCCEPTWTIIAPWLAAVAAGEDDNDPAARERGLLDAVEVVSRCDAIILCGGRISSGMQRELDEAVRCGHRVYDLTSLAIGGLPPTMDVFIGNWQVKS